MSGGYNETIGRGQKDDAGDTFLLTKWTKMGTSIGTVHRWIISARKKITLEIFLCTWFCPPRAKEASKNLAFRLTALCRLFQYLEKHLNVFFH